MSQTVRIGRFQPVHEDARRAIQEQEFPEEPLSLQHQVIKARLPLGNHFHAHKREVFVVLRGAGHVRYAAVDAEGNAGEATEHDVGPGSVVVVPPRVAHAFLLEPGSELIYCSEVLFDEDDLNPLPLIPTP